MTLGDEIRVDLPGNTFIVAEYKRTDMWGNIEGYYKGCIGKFIDNQLQAVAIYYLKTEQGVSFSVDAPRVHLLSSGRGSAHNAKCECGSEAVGSSKHSYFCPKGKEV